MEVYSSSSVSFGLVPRRYGDVVHMSLYLRRFNSVSVIWEECIDRVLHIKRVYWLYGALLTRDEAVSGCLPCLAILEGWRSCSLAYQSIVITFVDLVCSCMLMT